MSKMPALTILATARERKLSMSVYRRRNKDGSTTWWFTKTINGVRHRQRIPTASTRKQAKDGEREYMSQLHDDTFGKITGTITLKEFFDKTYMKWAKENKKSWRHDDFRSRPIIESFGSKRMCDISAFHVEAYKRKRLKTPVRKHEKSLKPDKPRTPATVNRELALLSAIFRVAIKHKQAATNPCSEVEYVKGEKNRRRFMTHEEEERLMRVLVDDRSHLRDMVLVAVNTGIRQGELFNLTVADVDVEKMEILIRETKNGEPRNVPLNDVAEEVVLRLRQRAIANKQSFLFINPHTGGKYLRVTSSWATACRLAKITDLRFHDLRHTFGTRAIENGATLAEVKEVLGHRSIKTTEGYVHATEKGKRRAVEAVLIKSGHITGTRKEEAKVLQMVSG